jgi:hypothetical protein
MAELMTVEYASALTPDQRRSQLHALMDDWKRNTFGIACLVRVMVNKGEKITEFAPPLIRVLIAIADKRFPAQYFSHDYARKVLAFTTEEQERVLNDEPIDVLASDGSILKELPSKMPKQTQKQVFAKDHIRDDAEQRAWLEAQRMKTTVTREQESSIRETTRGLEIRIGGSVTLIPWDDLAIRVGRRMGKG